MHNTSVRSTNKRSLLFASGTSKNSFLGASRITRESTQANNNLFIRGSNLFASHEGDRSSFVSASGQRETSQTRKPLGASGAIQTSSRSRRSTAGTQYLVAPRLPTGGIFMNMSQGDLFGEDVSSSADSDDSESGPPVVQEDFEAMALVSLSEGPCSSY